MKTLIILCLIFDSILAFSNSTGKIIELDSHIKKIMLVKGNKYKVSMFELAAVYYANEAILPCLRRSMLDKKLVSLKINPDAMRIVDCKQ